MKKRINIYLILIIAVAIIGVASIILINVFANKDDKKKEDDTPTTKEVVKEDDKDYKTLLKYNYLTVDYEIYLLKNDDLKVISKEKLYEVCKDQNCIKETDEIKTEEIKLSLNDDAKKKAIKVISSFSHGDNKEIDLSTINVEGGAMLVLDGIIANNSDMILLSDDLKIINKKEVVKDKSGRVVFNHSYDNIKDSNNQIVNAIKNHINPIVNKEYQEMLNDSKEFADNIDDPADLGVNYKLKVESINDTEISISYQIDGGLDGVGWYVREGYVYSVTNGKLLEYPKSYRDNAFANALKEFKKSEIYINGNEELYTNYEAVLRTRMFEAGNWYLTDSKVVFLVPGEELGFPEAIAKMIEIEIDRKDNY